MRATTQESGVLKLVHPGGYVEVHSEPITAAQVMKNNPRHCVTRPDVFKFPWIVVRPDSVLKLGKVFFVVPNHTLHSLLRACGTRRQPSLLRRTARQQSHVDDDQSATEQSGVDYWIAPTPEVQQSSYESWADATSGHRDLGRIKQPSRRKSFPEATLKQVDHNRRNPREKQALVSVNCSQPYRFDSCFKPLPQDISPLPAIKRQIRDQRISKHFPPDSKQRSTSSSDSSGKVRPICDKTLTVYGNRDVGSVLPPKKDAVLLKPKSNLRRPGDEARSRSLGLKVRFQLPSNDENDRSRR